MTINRIRTRPLLERPKIQRWIASAALIGSFVLTGCPTPPPQQKIPAFEPQPILDLTQIQPFRLERSFRFDWRRERPEVRSGMLIVLRADPDLLTRRNALEPVLYAGNHTVQRLNAGDESGFVVGIVPARLDLAAEPIWFGEPGLPERIDAKTIASERERAARAGIEPTPRSAIENRTRKLVVVPDLTTLLREQAANFVLEFSPQERRLADAWRLPTTE